MFFCNRCYCVSGTILAWFVDQLYLHGDGVQFGRHDTKSSSSKFWRISRRTRRCWRSRVSRTFTLFFHIHFFRDKCESMIVVKKSYYTTEIVFLWLFGTERNSKLLATIVSDMISKIISYCFVEVNYHDFFKSRYTPLDLSRFSHTFKSYELWSINNNTQKSGNTTVLQIKTIILFRDSRSTDYT